MLLAQLRNIFTADAVVNGTPIDRDTVKDEALTLTAQFKPVGTDLSGTTIAFDAKLQHSIDGVTFVDVASGAITTIAVGTEARASKIVNVRTTALYRWVRIQGQTSITGSPNYQTGTELIAHAFVN